MNEIESNLLVKWYEELENRLALVLNTVPYSSDTEDVFLPELPNILIDTCSLIDAFLRNGYVFKTSPPPKTRKELTINDFYTYYNNCFLLTDLNSIFLNVPAICVKPFGDWRRSKAPFWWSAHNKVKHDRIKQYKLATLKNAVHSVCALHQIISQHPSFLNSLIREEMICFGDYAPNYIVNEVYKQRNSAETLIIETKFFATTLGKYRFDDDIKKANKHIVSAFGKKLKRFLGLEYHY